MNRKSMLVFLGDKRRAKLYLPAAYTAVFPLIFGFMGRPAEMALAAATGLLLFAAVNLEKFESFKGAGFEAKLREAVNEAYATIERLQDVAAALAEPIVLSIAMQGRLLEQITLKGKFARIADIEDKLQAIGVPRKKIEGATEDFYTLVTMDHVRKVGFALRNVSITLRQPPLEFSVARVL